MTLLPSYFQKKTGNSKKGQKTEAHTVLGQTVIYKEWVMTPEFNSSNFSWTELTIHIEKNTDKNLVRHSSKKKKSQDKSPSKVVHEITTFIIHIPLLYGAETRDYMK